MMKLYTAAGACSTACHIALQESGVPFETKMMSFDSGDFDAPAFVALNPKGYVPMLEIESGKILNEGAAILQYIADQAPEKNLFPVKGFEKYKALEWLNYISTELHKGFSPLFSADRVFGGAEMEAAKAKYIASTLENLNERFQYVNQALEGKNYILGNQYSVVDAYLFTVLSWAKWTNVDLSSYKNIVSFQGRVFERPGTQRAFKTEGLLD